MASHLECFPVGLSGFGNSVWVASAAMRRETFDGVERPAIGEFLLGGEGTPVQIGAKNVKRWDRAAYTLDGIRLGIQPPRFRRVYLSELFSGLRPSDRRRSHANLCNASLLVMDEPLRPGQ